MRLRAAWLRVTAVPAIAVYFLIQTRDAWHSYFNPDACMNLYRSLDRPWMALLWANLLFLRNSSFYRPLGSAWYRVIYDLAGFRPQAFIAANLAMLGANIVLTYALARRLSGSQEAGILAALMASYHSAFGQLYFDLGFIYDSGCYFFYLAALLFYARIREHGRPPDLRELAALAALYICALNMKEMAVTLPAFVFFYEWLYQRGREGDWRAFALITALTAMFTAGRAMGRESLLTMSAYQPVFTWNQFLTTSRAFTQALLWRRAAVPTATLLLIWGGMLLVAVVSRSRALRFAWLWIMLTPVPVAFILPRGPAQYYVVLFGWALFAGTLLSMTLLPERLQAARTPALLAMAMAALWALNSRAGWEQVSTVSVEGEFFRNTVAQMHEVHPALKPKARVLFLDDPFDEDHQMMVLTRLSYEDMGLTVDTAKSLRRRPDPAEIARYDSVFDYRRGRMFGSAQARGGSAEPAVSYDLGRVAVFHADWTPVTPAHPAQLGERVISMMEDLGETEPAVAPDQPFPDGPFAKVTGVVEVRVDGEAAKVLLQIGWPGKANRFRVDFRIPVDTKTGEKRAIEVRTRGFQGPPTTIPVE